VQLEQGGHIGRIFALFSLGSFFNFFKKEVARGGERTRVLSISFIFSFLTTLLLNHSGSPQFF
jgi:hypothetical protein